MVFSLWLAFWASTCFTTPSAAQKGETAALSAKINDLSRAGKYAEAAALAQGQVENLEKKYGPAHRDVGAALNNLAQVSADEKAGAADAKDSPGAHGGADRRRSGAQRTRRRSGLRHAGV